MKLSKKVKFILIGICGTCYIGKLIIIYAVV